MPSPAVAGSTAFKLTVGAQAATAAAVLGAVGLFVLSPDAQRDEVQVEPLASRVTTATTALLQSTANDNAPTYQINPPMVAGMLSQIANAPAPPVAETPTIDNPIEPTPVATGSDDDISKLYAYLGMVSMTGADGADRRLALIKLNAAGGQRMIPAGTDLGDGRVLVEINSDGVVFETDGTRTALSLAARSGPTVSTSTGSAGAGSPVASPPGVSPSVMSNTDESAQDRIRRAEESRRRALERAREIRENSGDSQTSNDERIRPQSRLGADRRGSIQSATATAGPGPIHPAHATDAAIDTVSDTRPGARA